MRRTYHYSVEVVYREEFAVEAGSKAEADVKAQDMFNDRDSAVWDAVAMGDPDVCSLNYEGFEREDGERFAIPVQQRPCLTRRPKEERGEASWG
ncbi:MAG: hypothetical protein LUD72_13830 [Bacteroidales bacterium]|nr:hypothetical protein [Bacteroidales bacterium]